MPDRDQAAIVRLPLFIAHRAMCFGLDPALEAVTCSAPVRSQPG